MSSRLPMTGSLFGPGGKGKLLDGHLAYNQAMAPSKAPAYRVYCQLCPIRTCWMGDSKTNCVV